MESQSSSEDENPLKIEYESDDSENSLHRISISWKGAQKPFQLDGSSDNFQEFIKEYIKTTNPRKINEKSFSQCDSDDDFEEFQSQVETHSYSLKSPVEARRTTISCKDGNIKGNELLVLLRTETKNAFKYILPKNESIYMNTHPAVYFALNAGKFAKFKTTIDGRQIFTPGDYYFGLSHVHVTLQDDERLVIQDQELKDWITVDLKLNVNRWDLPYRGYMNQENYIVGIQDILEKILEKIRCQFCDAPVPDNELGTIQLYCAFPGSYPLGEHYEDVLKQGALHKFLDFFNALIFGVEASRNYTVFFTGMLTLLYMRVGSTNKEGQLLYEDLLDLFPLCTTGTGAGNFILEKALHLATKAAKKNARRLEKGNKRKVGFGFFRDNDKWLKVTLKTVLLIYLEIINNGMMDCSKTSRKKFFKDFKETVLREQLFHHYGSWK